MCMNWTRTILDGLAMAAYFNLFAGFVALYRPRLMFPCYPPAIIKAAKDPPTGVDKPFLPGYGSALESCCLSFFMVRSVPWRAGTTGFWPLALTGYIQWMMVNFCDLFFSGFLADSEEGEKPVYHPGNGGTPRLCVQSLDERLRSAGAPAPVAVFDVSYHGGGPSRAGAAHRYVLVNCKKRRCAA